MRLLGAVVAGYVAMFLAVFLLLTGAYLALGTERAFQPGTYDVTGEWIVVYVLVSVGAAMLGGVVVSRVSADRRAPLILAGLVLTLGMASAFSASGEAPDSMPIPRSADVPNMQAMMQAKSPTWALYLTPLIGAVGVLVGARRRAR